MPVFVLDAWAGHVLGLCMHYAVAVVVQARPICHAAEGGAGAVPGRFIFTPCAA